MEDSVGPSGGAQLPGSAGRSRERSQSSVLGLSLVFGMVIAGSVVIVLFGAAAIEDSQETLGVQRAEKAMTQFDSQAALVALGSSDTQRVDFGSGTSSKFELDKDAGFIRVTRQNLTDSSKKTRLVQEKLGSIVYETERNSLAYQGGGVWRHSTNSSRMISPPEFHYRNGTLTLPIIQVNGDLSRSNSVTVSHNETTRTYPLRTVPDRDNPLTNHKVIVTVKSDYYEAWGTYFETRTDGEVAYDHKNNIANLTLVSPLGRRTITSAAKAAGASNQLTISGSGPVAGLCSGNSKRYLDSYNSSKPDDYCSQSPSNDGNITYGGDVDVQNADIKVLGDIRSGGQVTVQQNAHVDGDIYYTTSPKPDDDDPSTGPVFGNEVKINGVGVSSAINAHIESVVSSVRSDNSNDDTSAISGNRLDFSGGTTSQTLTAGDYYLENIDFETSGGEELILDTDGGNIRLVVDEYIHLDVDNTVDVDGGGSVEIYVNGSHTGGATHLSMGENAQVLTEDDDATKLRIYGKNDFEGVFEGHGDNRAQFRGVIYAPPGNSGSSSLTVDMADVFGGVVVNDLTLRNQGALHYDVALKGKQIVSRSAKIVKVTYLHVTTNRIDVNGN